MRMGVPHGEGLAAHPGLESCVAVRAMTRAKLSDLANTDTFPALLLEGVHGKAAAGSRKGSGVFSFSRQRPFGGIFTGMIGVRPDYGLTALDAPLKSQSYGAVVIKNANG